MGLFWIHGFRDSVPVLKIHGCYYDAQKIRATFHSYPSDTRWLQYVDVNNPLQKVFKRVYNDLINICSEISKIRFDFMNGLFLQYERAKGSWKIEQK